MSKHTLRRWEADFHICCGLWEILDQNGEQVLGVHHVGEDSYGAINSRDAALLIAAAPDLLEALVDLEEFYTTIGSQSDDVTQNRLHERARLAIAKAEGGAP